MNKCLLCDQTIAAVADLNMIFSFRSIVMPVICSNCTQSFVSLTNQKTCLDCGRLLKQVDVCGDCHYWRQHGHQFSNKALYEYNPAMKEYMSRYKFIGDYRLRQVFRNELSQVIRASHKVIIPIPVSVDTIKHRGFNQVTGWFKKVNYYDVLMPIKKKKIIAQSEKNRQQRLQTPQPFQIIASAQSVILNQDVLIVDDVYTTGTTIRHAANLIQAAGARSVSGLTLCR